MQHQTQHPTRAHIEGLLQDTREEMAEIIDRLAELRAEAQGYQNVLRSLVSTTTH